MAKDNAKQPKTLEAAAPEAQQSVQEAPKPDSATNPEVAKLQENLTFFQGRVKELETEIEGLKEQLKQTKQAEKATEKELSKRGVTPSSIPPSAIPGTRGQRSVRTVR